MCRKTCSTIHNPLFHGKKEPHHLRYAPIKEVNERAESADHARRRHIPQNIDWFTSEIYQYIHYARIDPAIKISKTTNDSSINPHTNTDREEA
jgi:hypothetical protein